MQHPVCVKCAKGNSRHVTSPLTGMCADKLVMSVREAIRDCRAVKV